MDAEQRKAIKSAGWEIMDAAEYVGLTDEEKQLVYARVEIAIAVRRLREAMSLSQKDLAVRLKTSQPRVAKIEQAAPDVSFDQLFRAYAAAGGRIEVTNKSRNMKIKLNGAAK